jgi:hypothetical protein
MAGTASPQSDPPSTGAPRELLAAASGAHTVEIAECAVERPALRGSIDRRAASAPALFYCGYESESGWATEPRRVRFWEIASNVRRVIIGLEQTDRYMIGGQSNLDLALMARH